MPLAETALAVQCCCSAVRSRNGHNPAERSAVQSSGTRASEAADACCCQHVSKKAQQGSHQLTGCPTLLSSKSARIQGGRSEISEAWNCCRHGCFFELRDAFCFSACVCSRSKRVAVDALQLSEHSSGCQQGLLLTFSMSFFSALSFPSSFSCCVSTHAATYSCSSCSPRLRRAEMWLPPPLPLCWELDAAVVALGWAAAAVS